MTRRLFTDFCDALHPGQQILSSIAKGLFHNVLKKWKLSKAVLTSFVKNVCTDIKGRQVGEKVKGIIAGSVKVDDFSGSFKYK